MHTRQSLSLLLFISLAPLISTANAGIQSLPAREAQSEKEFKEELDRNIDKLNFIEGIWLVKERTRGGNFNTPSPPKTKYRLGVVEDNASDSWDFVGFVIETEVGKWKKGMIKCRFRKMAYNNIYEGSWYNAKGKEINTEFYVQEDGTIRADLGKGHLRLIKAYPSFNDFYAGGESNPGAGSKAMSGSGCLVSKTGIILTSNHVVGKNKHITIEFPAKKIKLKGKLLLMDKQNDIALLQAENFSMAKLGINKVPVFFNSNAKIKMGQDVFTIGFPLGDNMGKTTRYSAGKINSLFGFKDDPRVYQISIPIQPGNSGGPLFTNRGEYIGMVMSSLNARFFYENAGFVPQNVNFAIKSNYITSLINMLPEGNKIVNRPSSNKGKKVDALVEAYKPLIVFIETK